MGHLRRDSDLGVHTYHHDHVSRGRNPGDAEVLDQWRSLPKRDPDAVGIWIVNDDVGMDHPFHLHGMFFQVLDVDDVPVLHQGWKDTVIVPRYRKLRFAVRYGDPGHWMYHCHILEHQEAGMMGVLDVAP